MNNMYKEDAALWEKTFEDNEWGKYPMLELVRFIAKNYYKVQDRKNIKILELGSGPGANLWYMAREGFTVYGIDGSKAACGIAMQRLEKENLSDNIGEIKIGDYFDILESFENDYFDAIIDIESIYCNSFERSKQIVSKSFDKLKIGGKFFSVTFANKEWISNKEDIDYHAISNCDTTGYFRYTTKDDIELLYKNSKNIIENIQMIEFHTLKTESKKEWIVELVKI